MGSTVPRLQSSCQEIQKVNEVTISWIFISTITVPSLEISATLNVSFPVYSNTDWNHIDEDFSTLMDFYYPYKNRWNELTTQSHIMVFLCFYFYSLIISILTLLEHSHKAITNSWNEGAVCTWNLEKGTFLNPLEGKLSRLHYIYPCRLSQSIKSLSLFERDDVTYFLFISHVNMLFFSSFSSA